MGGVNFARLYGGVLAAAKQELTYRDTLQHRLSEKVRERIS